MFRHKGHRNLSAFHREGGVAAKAAGLCLLPAAVGLPDIDTSLAGRQVADGVLSLAVIGKLQQPLLSHAAKVPAGFLRRHLQGIGTAEQTLHQEDRAAIVPGLGTGQGRGVGGVHRPHRGIQMDVVHHGGAPLGIETVLLGQLGVIRLREGVAIRDGAALNDMAIGREGQRQILEACRGTFQRPDGFKCRGLGLPGAAHAVDARQRIGDEEVAHKFAVLPAGDGPPILGVGVRVPAGNAAVVVVLLAGVGPDIHDGAVFLRHTAVACQQAVGALAHDATHILFAGEGALGPVGEQLCAGGSGNAAHFISALHIAVALALGHKAQVHPADDAAHGLFFGLNGAFVDAAEHHGADGILGAQQGLVVVLIVVLGV